MKRIVLAALLFAPPAIGLVALADETPVPKKNDDNKLILQIAGSISAGDEPDKVRGVPSKVHAVKLSKNTSYLIDLVSTDFDSFLRLEDSAGKTIAEDDDSGGNLNARIRVTISADGLYYINASPLGQGEGNYTLSVRTYVPAPVKMIALPAPTAGKPSEIQSQLNDNDPPAGFRNAPGKTHTVDLKAGKTYVIDLTSPNFDTYLYLQDANGMTLAQDDDGGGNLNSRIRHRITADGRYRLVATSFNGKVGAYTIRVAEEP